MEFHERFVAFLPELKKVLTAPDSTDWSVKGFIDTNHNIYPITTDTKVISKVVELMLFPCMLKFARDNGLRIELPPHQNYYPDVTFIDALGNKYAVDLKTTYRITPSSVNGMTLGAFTGYFRNRTSPKNVLFPYSAYKKHYVLGVIYSRSDIDSITSLLTSKGIKLTLARRKALITYMNAPSDENWNAFAVCPAAYKDEVDAFLVDELKSYNIDTFPQITSAARNFDFFFQEKWRLAIARPGSGNTKNIGSETTISLLQEGEGLFFREYGADGEEKFDQYWTQYQTIEMAKAKQQAAPYYNNLKSFEQWLQNK